MDVGAVLDLRGTGSAHLSSVSLQYSIVKSSLEVDWLYNGQTIDHTVLPRGLRKEVSFTYDRPLPASIELRFTGPKGQLAISDLSAVESQRTPIRQRAFDVKLDDTAWHSQLAQLSSISPATPAGQHGQRNPLGKDWDYSKFIGQIDIYKIKLKQPRTGKADPPIPVKKGGLDPGFPFA